MIKRKIFAAITGLAVAAMIVAPSSAQALTAAELQTQINALMAQLATLQGQLSDLGGSTGGTVTGCAIASFTKNLSQGMTGADVKCLQIVLNSASDTKVALSGAGSSGNETTFFGSMTKAGVVKFQEKYASEILAVYGLTSGTGYVGSTTRAKLNTLLSSGGTGGTGGTGGETGGETVPAGALSVAITSDSPETATVPANATAAAYNVPALKVKLTAGDGPVTVTGLKILRSGMSEDAAVDSIRLYDEDGNQIGTSQSLGSNHKASFTSISIKVPANSTKIITAKVSMTKSASYTGNVLKFGIESASDITSNATSVGGTFPIVSNAITLSATVTIGTATLYNGTLGTRNAADLTVDPVQKDIRFTQVKISAGSAEGFIVKQITAVKNGTAASSDVTNIRLVNDTSGATLGTVNALNSDGRAVFSNLNVAVTKGGYVELSILADMNNSGAGRTIAFDLHDGVAYTIDVVGSTYGYGLTPTRSDFCGSTGTCTAQAINQGYMTVQKSPKTPATGYIAIGASQVEIAAFDFAVYGEAVNITSTQVLIDPTTATASQFTNITGYDDSGAILFGPKDGTTASASDDQTLTFTDSYSLPIGINTIHIKTNVATDVTASDDTVDFEIPANSITGKGATSGKNTYITSSSTTKPPSAAVTGNLQTVQGPALAVITAGTPVADYVVRSAQDEIFAYFDLDATASGENVKVTTILAFDTTDGSTANTSYEQDIINLELWGDPDTTDSVAENIKLETTTSTAVQADTALTTFTFKTPLKIKKGTTTRLTLKADVASDASAAAHRFVLSATGYVTSAGWSTGTAIGETYSGTGQAQTVATEGKLKIIASADIPAKAQFAAGTTGNTVMQYRMYAYYEDVAVTEFKIATEGTPADVRASVAKVKIYFDGKQIGATAGYSLDAGGDASITLDAGQITVPKNTWKDFVIKVDLGDKAQLTDNTSMEIGLADFNATAANRDDGNWGEDSAASVAGKAYYMVATGAKSGATIDSDESTGYINSTASSAGYIYASYQHKLYDGVLVVSKNSSSPSGSFTAGENTEVLRLNLQAVGDDITVNEMEFCVTGSETTVNGTGSVYIKSSDLGTTYATLTRSGFDAYWDTLLSTGDYYPLDPEFSSAGGSCFSIGNSHQTANTIAGKSGYDVEQFSTTLQIAEGTTKTVVVLGDTSRSGTTASKTLQLNLTANSSGSFDATTAGINWKNNSGNEVDETITKNTPVTGGTLVY
jgi:hypothetical protein